MSRIIAKQSHYLIENVIDIPPDLVYNLSVFNKYNHTLKPIGFQYDKTLRELRIPRGYSEETIKRFFPEHAFVLNTNGFDKFETVDIELTSPPRDYKQQHILTYMLGRAPYEYTAKHSQVYIDLDTGDGKTYAGIATACFHKHRMVIFTPSDNSKIGKQWLQSCTKFTTLTSDEVLLIKGSKCCDDIMNGKYEHVKIFIIPCSTVLAYVKHWDNNWHALNALVGRMNVGTKIIDEAHKNFTTLVGIDNYTNTKHTYYMSSSPERSKFDENKIYKALFYNVPKYGKQLKTSKQNHIRTLIINFNHKPSYQQIKDIKTKEGPSQALYEQYLMSENGAEEEFIEAYAFAIYSMFKHRNNNGKLLVLVMKTETAKKLAHITELYFPMYSTGLYIGSGKNKDKELENDIIFSTLKGFGTGAETDNLQFMINTITYASSVSADQIPGRLREIPGSMSIYCEVVNKSHTIAADHYATREPNLMKKSKNGRITSHTITSDNIIELNKFLDKGYWFDGNGLIRSRNGHYVIQKHKKCL